jgi:hypothetical protein
MRIITLAVLVGTIVQIVMVMAGNTSEPVRRVLATGGMIIALIAGLVYGLVSRDPSTGTLVGGGAIAGGLSAFIGILVAHALGYVPWSGVFGGTVGSIVTGAIGGWLSKLLLPGGRPPGGGSGPPPVDYKEPFEEGRYRPLTGSETEDTERTPAMRMDPAPPNALADDTPGSAIRPGDPPAM